jgi:hypothetical protein
MTENYDQIAQTILDQLNQRLGGFVLRKIDFGDSSFFAFRLNDRWEFMISVLSGEPSEIVERISTYCKSKLLPPT